MIKINYKSLYCIAFLCIIFSCSNQDYDHFYESDKRDKDFILDKVREMIIKPHSPDSNIIGRLRTRFAVNRDNNLFAFYDEIARQFLITDKEGFIKSVISGKGKGPGEVVKAGGFDFDEEDRLVVYDEGQIRITVFNLNGEIVQTSKMENTDYSMGGRKLFISGTEIYTDVINQNYLGDLQNAWQSDLIGVYDYDGKLVNTMGKYDPLIKEAMSYVVFPVINIDYQDHLILSAHSSGYTIQLYDLRDGERIAWFGTKTSNFNESEEYISSYQSRQKIKEQSIGISFTSSVHSTSEFIVLHFENLTKSFFENNNFNDKDVFVAIYDKESYDSYGDISLPYALGNIFDDQFYLIENDNPDNYTIGIYELVEES